MSDEVIVDLSNYKDRVGQRVAPGRYRVLVEDAEQDKSQAGNLMINTWLRVTGGEFDGSVIVDRMTLTDKALFRIVGFMQAIGLPTPKKRLKVNLGQFRGKYLEIDVEDGDPYNGRVKSEVRGYLRIRNENGGSTATRTAAATELTEDEIEAGVAEHSTPDNPGKGGMDEFAPVGNATVQAPEEVDLENLDLG